MSLLTTKIQNEIDELFERLEIASEMLDEINYKYKIELNKLI